MLKTPLGTINVYVDGVSVDFEASEFLFDRHPCKEKPVAGCYRIEVDAHGRSTVSCAIELNDPSLKNTGDSGQDYLNTEFIIGNTILNCPVFINVIVGLDRLVSGKNISVCHQLITENMPQEFIYIAVFILLICDMRSKRSQPSLLEFCLIHLPYPLYDKVGSAAYHVRTS